MALQKLNNRWVRMQGGFFLEMKGSIDHWLMERICRESRVREGLIVLYLKYFR